MDTHSSEDVSKLLQASQARITADELPALIAGVAAAPGDDGGMGNPEAWMSMVAESPSEQLRAHLRAALDEYPRTEAAASGNQSSERLAALRGYLAGQEIDGFIVPLADELQGEYVSKRARRLAWLTGFTGSAGIAIVLKNRAAVFVDGRYTLQAAQQVDEAAFAVCPLADTNPADWLADQDIEGRKIGFDPWLHTADGALRMRTACEKAGAAFVALPQNAVDAVWEDQPPRPLSPVLLHGAGYAGRSSAEKRSEIAEKMKKKGENAVVLTAPDSVAWLANIRGGDVPYTPLPLGFGVLRDSGDLSLFVDRQKVLPGTAAGLEQGIDIADYDDFVPALMALGAENAAVRVDPSSAAEAVFETLETAGADIRRGTDPCALPKACKNAAELDGTRRAHIRDGAALTRFLAWLDREALAADATEMSAAGQLEAFRRENELIQGLSFPTISGAGPNGAIVHYRVTPETDRKLEAGTLFLVDSGAQYLDGTTDVTRTVALGEPSDEMRDRFTRVLKGHIALARAKFPEGTSGSQLDILARAPLWNAGIDFEHGTGHGVGSYLGVHEGPHRISKLPNRVGLEPGMIVSNEPGYYKTGEYGIRIENLITVVETEAVEGSERKTFGFETLTCAPIDRRLIVRSLLDPAELEWLNGYHAWVAETVSPLVDPETRDWLREATKEI